MEVDMSSTSVRLAAKHLACHELGHVLWTPVRVELLG